VKLVWSPAYHLDIGTHVWPTGKYGRIRERLLAVGGIDESDFVEPGPASWDDLALVHTPDYLHKVRSGTLTIDDLVRLELPLSPAIVEGFRLMTGGTMRAAELALTDGIAVHLGGGLHHAFAGHGEGFCLFNDVAVSIRRLQRDGRVVRAAIVDCDVHQGNGTADIFAGDPSVFTFSIHQQNNYPALKPQSSLDIGLADGTRDATYLHDLELALPDVVGARPDLLYYLAGADPFEEDQLGGLRLTLEGLRHRDRLVFAAAARIPVVIVLAGGYARRSADTVAIHTATVVEALAAAAHHGPGRRASSGGGAGPGSLESGA
jgi:acetoin utilization deacetylase AcuC-like enzyme